MPAAEDWSLWKKCALVKYSLFLVFWGLGVMSLELYSDEFYERFERSVLPTAEPTKKQNYAHMEDQIAAVFNKVAFESGSFKPTFRIQVPAYQPTESTPEVQEVTENAKTVSSKLLHPGKAVTRPESNPTHFPYPEWFTAGFPSQTEIVESNVDFRDGRTMERTTDVTLQTQLINSIAHNASNWDHLYSQGGKQHMTKASPPSTSVEQKESRYQFEFDSLFSLMVPDLHEALKIYGVAWDIHNYITSTLFSALGACSLIAIFMLISEVKLIPPISYCVFHVSAMGLSITRGVSFFSDPYNLGRIFPGCLGNLLFDIGTPCLTIMFGVLIRCLLKRATINTVHKHTKLALTFWIALSGQILIVILCDVIAHNVPTLSILYLTSSIVHIFSMTTLSLIFAWMIRKVTCSVNAPESKVKFLPKRMIDSNTRFALIICSWVGMLIMVSVVTTIYYVIDVSRVLQGGAVQLWPWWTYQFILRLLEILISYLLLYTSTFTLCDKNHFEGKSHLACCSINNCFSRCQQKLPVCRTESPSSTERDEYPELYMTNSRVPNTTAHENYFDNKTCTLPIIKFNHKASTIRSNLHSISRASLSVSKVKQGCSDKKTVVPYNDTKGKPHGRTLSAKPKGNKRFVPVDTCREQFISNPSCESPNLSTREAYSENKLTCDKFCTLSDKMLVRPTSSRCVTSQEYSSPATRSHSRRRRPKNELNKGLNRLTEDMTPHLPTRFDNRVNLISQLDVYNIPYSRDRRGTLANDKNLNTNSVVIDGGEWSPNLPDNDLAKPQERKIMRENRIEYSEKYHHPHLDRGHGEQSDSESFHEYSDWLIVPEENVYLSKRQSLRGSRSYSCTPREQSVASDCLDENKPRFSSQIRLDISAAGTPELKERKSVYLSNIRLQISPNSPSSQTKNDHVPSMEISSTTVTLNEPGI